jgi:hypothetical protein
MKDLETRLREEAARERQRQDPGDAFWEKLPGATWQAFQQESERRQRRWAFWRRLAVPLMTTCAAATALLLVVRVHHPLPPTKAAGPLVVEPASLETAADEVDDAALERLAHELDVGGNAAAPGVELLEHWNVPVDVMVDELSDKQIDALAERLGNG